MIQARPRLGELAVGRGLLSVGALRDTLAHQRALAARGTPVPLGTLLAHTGALDATRVRALLREQQSLTPAEGTRISSTVARLRRRATALTAGRVPVLEALSIGFLAGLAVAGFGLGSRTAHAAPDVPALASTRVPPACS